MSNNTNAHRQIMKNLKHLSQKVIIKAFFHWHYRCKLLSVRITEGNTKFTSKIGQITVKTSPVPVKPSRIENSPKEISSRLYNKAQEIENHKNELRKSLIPEYSFTPKLSSGTQKWLDSKSKKDLRLDEEVAVVSGSKVLSFNRINPGFGESKIPGVKAREGKRIISSRLDRRSDIVQGIEMSPNKNGRTHNKSVSKC